MASFDEAFVEVADGRVSRVHCCIGRATNPATASQQAYLEVRQGPSHVPAMWAAALLGNSGTSSCSFHSRIAPVRLWWVMSSLSAAAAQDLSSNGTFVNGRKLKSAQDAAGRRWLTPGDRISLVMSVKPLHEQYYIYHTGGRGPLNSSIPIQRLHQELLRATTRRSRSQPSQKTW